MRTTLTLALCLLSSTAAATDTFHLFNFLSDEGQITLETTEGQFVWPAASRIGEANRSRFISLSGSQRFTTPNGLDLELGRGQIRAQAFGSNFIFSGQGQVGGRTFGTGESYRGLSITADYSVTFETLTPLIFNGGVGEVKGLGLALLDGEPLPWEQLPFTCETCRAVVDLELPAGIHTLSIEDYQFDGGHLVFELRVPEPSTWLLLAGGVGLVLVFRRRGHAA